MARGKTLCRISVRTKSVMLHALMLESPSTRLIMNVTRSLMNALELAVTAVRIMSIVVVVEKSRFRISTPEVVQAFDASVPPPPFIRSWQKDMFCVA